MKRNIQLAFTGIVLAVLTSGVLVFNQLPSLWLMGMIGVVVVLAGWLILSFTRYAKKLRYQTSELLHNGSETIDRNQDVWEHILYNQQLVKRKQELTVSYIKQLDSSNGQEKLDDLFKNDAIGEALLNVRSQLQQLKKEEDKRNWITNGLAQFSEILRNKDELNVYAQKIISQLVRYLGANQGALFLEDRNEDKERYLELVACYAYDRKKFVNQRINEGEGILGQCMLEKDFVFITDVPSSYVKITSGLGEATPRNVVVAPLLFNEQFYGAIELALFEVMQPHQVEFLKRIVENIASEMAAIKGLQKTQVLLSESEILTAELQTREEEMKQNLEELAATQEEMARKQGELSGIVNAIDSTLATAEFSAEGKLQRHNAILQDFVGYSAEELMMKDFTVLMRKQLVPWKNILTGQIKAGDFETSDKQGNALWLSITFTPMVNSLQQVEKVLCMIQNITEKKNKEIEFERLSLVANNTDNSVIITNAEGFTEYVNAGFTKMTGYLPHEIIGKKPGALLQGPLTDAETVEQLRSKIACKEPVFEEILNYNKDGNTYWVSLAINPVTDETGTVTRFISIQADITETKMKSLDFHQKMKALSKSNAILELDLQGTIIDINDNYAHVLGYEVADLLGKPYHLITKKEKVFAKLVDQVRQDGLQNGEYTRYDKSGNKHCMKLMDYPVVDLKGELVKIIEFGVDVSKQKLLERDAQRKQLELSSYLAAINNTIASAEFDMQGNIRFGNEIFRTVMGYSQDELQGKHYRSLMLDEPSVHLMWENLQLGKFFSGEFRLRDAEGNEMWLTGTFNPIIVEEGIPEKILMFAQFTTQEKEKINDLSSLVTSLKATLPIVEFNENFTCKTANDKFLKMFGISRVEIRSKRFDDFIDEYQRNIFIPIRQEMVQQEHSTLLIPFHYKGKTETYETSFTVIRNLEGKISRLVFILIRTVEERVPVMAVV